jgi:hypothetical protein
MSLVQSKPARNGDYRHAQSLGQQRKYATTSPREQAEAIAKVVRKRLSDSQAVPDLDKYRLDASTWAELLDVLTADELSAVADACGGDDLDGDDDEPSADDITRAFEDDVPFAPEPPAPQQTPRVAQGWRNHEAPVVHSVTWTDGSGLKPLFQVPDQKGLKDNCEQPAAA